MELTQNGRERLIASIVTSVVVLSSVFLRFWCKLLIKDGIHLDDWVMLSTVPIYVIGYASIIWGIFNGGKGRPMSELVAAATLDPSPENTSVVETYFKSVLGPPAAGTMHQREPLLPPHLHWGDAARCHGHGVARPSHIIRPNTPEDEAHRRGHLLLGGFAVITDLLRIYYTYTSGVETNEALFWGEVHTATAVLCGNLPVYQPIRTRIGNRLSVIKSAFESAFSRLQNERRKRATAETRGDAGTCAIGGRKSISADSLNMRLNPNARQHIVIAWGSDLSHDDMELPSRGIVHTRNFEVV
ncbi:hypothetical protein PG995_013159 [Apiospora arundinis]